MASGIESSFENVTTAEELESKMFGEEVHPYMSLYRPILDPSTSISDTEEDSTEWSTNLQDQDAPKLIRTSVLQKHPVQYATRIYDVLSIGASSSGTNSSSAGSPSLHGSEIEPTKQKEKKSDESENKEKTFQKENASSLLSIVSEGSGRSNRPSSQCLEDNGPGNKSAEERKNDATEQSDEIGPCFRDQPGPSFFSRTNYSDGKEKKKKDRKRKRVTEDSDGKNKGDIDSSTDSSTDSDSDSDSDSSSSSSSSSDSDSEDTVDFESKKHDVKVEEEEGEGESKDRRRKKRYKQRTSQELYPNGKYPDADFEAIAKEKPNEDYSKDVMTDNGAYKDYFWNLRFRELLEYHKKFDTLHVPKDGKYKTLGNFCQMQRAALKEKIMHPDRFRRLNSIGFVWNPLEGRGTWDDHFQTLVAFHKKNGHANVPKRYKPLPELGQWCRHQRSLYNHERYPLKPERVEKLESLGFSWDVTMREWRKRYEELKQFKKEHGHFRVPEDHDNSLLVRWLKLRQEEWARGTLPDEHEAMLSLIGLDFAIEEKKKESADK